MVNISAAMGSQFARFAAEINEEIIKLGPSPLKRVETKVDVSA
jgi:coenzyme F420-reducing hydrogenase delta subunit